MSNAPRAAELYAGSVGKSSVQIPSGLVDVFIDSAHMRLMALKYLSTVIACNCDSCVVGVGIFED